MSKLINLAKAKEIRVKAKEKGEIIVFTNGCFDILHRGHIQYLRQAKELGDILVIGLNTDNSIHNFKSKSRPIFNQDDRAEVLSALTFVDYIVLFDELTPQNLIEKIEPDILVKGGDYKMNEIVGRETVRKCGGNVIILPLLQGYSTTEIINKIKNK